jgi:hypothetical protein
LWHTASPLCFKSTSCMPGWACRSAKSSCSAGAAACLGCVPLLLPCFPLVNRAASLCMFMQEGGYRDNSPEPPYGVGAAYAAPQVSHVTASQVSTVIWFGWAGFCGVLYPGVSGLGIAECDFQGPMVSHLQMGWRMLPAV